jgi:hypothetical protein
MEQVMNDGETSLWSGRLGSGSSDRRSAPRLTPRERRTWIGWWDGEEYHVVPACLVDVAQGGVAIAVDQAGPRIGGEVVVRLDKSQPHQCAEAHVVGLTPRPDGSSLLHLRFPSGCPPHMYLAAVHGLPELGEDSN